MPAVKKEKERKKLNLSDLRSMAIDPIEPGDVELLERVQSNMSQAFVDLNLRTSLMNYVHSKITRQIFTRELDTFAVAALGDGSVVLFVNPDFADSLDDPIAGTSFGLLHEVYHVIERHLALPAHLANDESMTLACEVVINHAVMKRLSCKLPTRTISETGKSESVGIDPKKIYREYSKVVDGPVSYEDFTSTVLRCYSELSRMPKPPAPKGMAVCVHMPESGVGDDTDGTGQGVGIDGETIDRIVSGAMGSVVSDALKGDSKAREEILDIAKTTEGSDKSSKFWGDLSLGSLRGETVATRKIEWWSRWLRRTMASVPSHGAKLIYPRKRAAILSALGSDSPMLHRGAEKKKLVVRAIDTSGSMSNEFLDKFFQVAGQTSGVEWVDLAFDAEVMPYSLGAAVHGGGGTSFKVVQDYVEGNREINGKKISRKPDAVIIVTDGYAPEITPAYPKNWIWLITPGGDMWMEDSMACHEVDLPTY